MLREVFFNSAVFVSEQRFEELLKGMTLQQAEEVDGNFVEDVSIELFILNRKLVENKSCCITK